jgi:hypothetical protein
MGRKENTIYYYKIRAIDDANFTSLFSEIIFGKTLFNPRPPEINKIVDDIEILEDTYDNRSINLYVWFKDINNDPLVFSCEGQKHIQVIIFQKNGTVILKPKKDWNGEEKLTFYVNDGYYNISDNVSIIVYGVNDPPLLPQIIEPQHRIETYTNEPIDLKGNCYDPDIRYGDKLTFKWSSNLMGELGIGQNLSDIILSPGVHIITLEVSDTFSEKTNTSISIKVQEKNDEGNGDDKSIQIIIMSIVNVILIIILFILIFMYIKNKKVKRTNESLDELGIENKLEQKINSDDLEEESIEQ